MPTAQSQDRPRPRRSHSPDRRRTRKSPTATSASASSTGARASDRRPRSTSPPRRRRTARWTCGSGWSRRRQKCVDWPDGHRASIQPPSVYDQNPRFRPCRKLVILRGLSTFVGDGSKEMIVDSAERSRSAAALSGRLHRAVSRLACRSRHAWRWNHTSASPVGDLGPRHLHRAPGPAGHHRSDPRGRHPGNAKPSVTCDQVLSGTRNLVLARVVQAPDAPTSLGVAWSRPPVCRGAASSRARLMAASVLGSVAGSI